MKRIGLVLMSVALMAAAVACGNEQEPQATSTAAGATQASPTPATPTPCSVPEASEEPKSVESNVEVALLTDVRQTSEGCPRIVFEFENSVPGYMIRYEEPPFSECGSGAPIATEAWDADAYLVILLQPARGGGTYEGPLDISTGGPVLKHMRRSCDFEAQVEWIAGLDSRHGFTVRALTEPPRIVIDISQSA